MPTTHYNRELSTLNDLEISFPEFTGKGLSWVHNADDPPDFIAQGLSGPIGLELREWLDGQEMSAAQHREDQRKHMMRSSVTAGSRRIDRQTSLSLPLNRGGV